MTYNPFYWLGALLIIYYLCAVVALVAYLQRYGPNLGQASDTIPFSQLRRILPNQMHL